MIDEKLVEILHKEFHFDNFHMGQLEVIKSLLEGNNTLAVLPTGSGKSLIYQMMSFFTKQPILVISPLLSLMEDQIKRMHQLGTKRVIELSSNQSFEDRQFSLEHLGEYQFIYASPEILQNPAVQSAFKKITLSLVVVDEAHCVVQWGKTFRTAYLQLASFLNTIKNPLTLMLTATASAKTRMEILNLLNFDSNLINQFIYPIDRPNIYLGFKKILNSERKDQELIQLLQQLNGSGIIYFSSRKQANQVADLINTTTLFTAAAYHAGMSSLDRYHVQNQFQSNELNVICATSAFGMGIDKSDVRYVIHYHIPGNVESYMQEIGRAGRDGKQSIAIILYQEGDEYLQHRLNELSIPTYASVEGQFSDDKQLLVDYYKQQGLNDVQINEIFEKQRSQSSREIYEMLAIMNESSCHRQILLQHFESSVVQHDEKCCGWINHDIPITLEPGNQVINNSNLEKWQKKLKKIFK